MQQNEIPLNGIRHNSLPIRIVRAIGDSVADICAAAAALALLIIVGICSINVARRYLFGAAWSWAEEAMVYLMIFIVFAGAVTVTWRNTHMRIELIIDRFPPALRAAVVFVISVVAIVTLAAMSFFSSEVVMTLYSFEQKTDALEMPMWIPQGFIAAGFGLFAILAVMRLYVHGTARGQTELDIVAKDAL